jgi:hypothetical protein
LGSIKTDSIDLPTSLYSSIALRGKQVADA